LHYLVQTITPRAHPNSPIYRPCDYIKPLNDPRIDQSIFDYRTVRNAPLHLHGQRVEAPRQTIHHVAHSTEHPHATRPAFDVLTQPAERDKLGGAVRLWAPIDLVLVARAPQVLIEPPERVECGVAQETLVCLAVPRALGRPRFRGRGRLVVAQRAREQAVGVRDVVVRVGADDEAVEPLARHAGRTGSRLEMEDERGGRDERLGAAAAGAAHVGGPMQLRVEVVPEVGLVLEGPLAVRAVGVFLAVVFLELLVVVE